MAMMGLKPQAQMSGPAQAEMQTPMGAQPGAMAEAPEAEGNVSPEEQAQYDQFVGNALKLISSPKTREGLLKTLEGDGKPEEGLANATVMIVKRLTDSAKDNGVEISGDVMLHGGIEIVEALAETQVSAGIADLSEDQIEGAAYRAADLYREIAANEGTLNQEAAQQDLEALKAAEQAGQLGALLPGVGQGGPQMPNGGAQ